MALEQVPDALLIPELSRRAPIGYKIAASMELQRRDLWCWAAVVQFVLASANQSKLQCRIATAHFAHAKVVVSQDCCDAGSFAAASDCNRIRPLSAPLEENGCLKLRERWPGSLAAAKLVDQLRAGRVVALRIEFLGSGHFIAINGIEVDGSAVPQRLHFIDPYGQRQVTIPVAPFLAGDAKPYDSRWSITDVYWMSVP